MSAADITPGTAGARVRFIPGSLPYAKNAGVVWIVEADARLDVATDPEHPRPFVALLDERDEHKAPSRQRVRLAYVDALEVVAP